MITFYFEEAKKIVAGVASRAHLHEGGEREKADENSVAENEDLVLAH